MITAFNNTMSILGWLGLGNPALQNLDNPALQSEGYKNGTEDVQGNPIFTDGKGTKHYGYKSKQAFDASERAVGGKTIVGVTYGPGQKYSSVAGWNYDGFGDKMEDVGESGSWRDDAGNRLNYDNNGNEVGVGNRINAQVGASSNPSTGNNGGMGGGLDWLRSDKNTPNTPSAPSGGMGGGLNWLRDRSPMAVMGRQMTPAQQMLGDPNNPYSKAAVLQRDKKYGSLFPDR